MTARPQACRSSVLVFESAPAKERTCKSAPAEGRTGQRAHVPKGARARERRCRRALGGKGQGAEETIRQLRANVRSGRLPEATFRRLRNRVVTGYHDAGVAVERLVRSAGAGREWYVRCGEFVL